MTFEIKNNNGKMILEGTTPIGRLVQGDAFVPSDKDMKGNPLTVKSGPNAGKLRVEYFTGVAFQKGVAEVEAMRNDWAVFLRQCWPHLFTPDGRCVLPQGISDKWIDGDGYDTAGKAWATREGFAGHWVLRASSGFAPQVYAAGRYNPADQLAKGSIQLGAFVRENVTVESNLDATKPGVFVNLRMIELCGMGAPIIRGPDAAAAFAQPAGALPPGATALTPGAPAAPGAPVAPPAAPATPAAPVAPPAAPVAPPAAPVAPVVAHDPTAAALADGWLAHPSALGFYYKGAEAIDTAALALRYPAPAAPQYHGYATPPAAPVAPPAAPAVPAAPVVPAGPVMTAAAGGVTYDAYRAANWSDAQLIQAGFMIPGNVQ